LQKANTIACKSKEDGQLSVTPRLPSGPRVVAAEIALPIWPARR